MRLLAIITCLAACLAPLTSQIGVVVAGPTASVGDLAECGLTLHEAWVEARLSMDAARLDVEWRRLVDGLKISLRGKARVNVTGSADDWVVELQPLSGPTKVRVDPSGARLVVSDGRDPREPRTLLQVYPWRRHYDCDGKVLSPSHPGVPHRGKPCAVPPGMAWRSVAEPASEDDGAVVQPVPGVPGCYLVASERGDILTPGQVLVDYGIGRYTMEQMSDDKLRVRYRQNRRLFVMWEKRPLGIVIAESRAGQTP